MTQDEAVTVVQVLNAGFPRDAIEPETVAVWVGELTPLKSYKAARAAARRVIQTGEKFPSFHEFMTAYRQAEERFRPPAILMSPEREPIPVEQREWIEQFSRGAFSEIPETESMKPRPVWARFERRRRMEPLLPPTEAEKHDAIVVLSEHAYRGGEQTHRAIRDLHLEAERIFIEASL